MYSGSFEGSVELDQFDQIRLVMGLQEDFFSYQLKPAQTFYAQEAVLSYSADESISVAENIKIRSVRFL